MDVQLYCVRSGSRTRRTTRDLSEESERTQPLYWIQPEEYRSTCALIDSQPKVLYVETGCIRLTSLRWRRYFRYRQRSS